MAPSELLTLACLAALTAASLAASPAAPVSAVGYAALAAATWAVTRRLPRGAFARGWFPVVTILAAFSLLEPVIAGLNPHLQDAALAALDARWWPALVPGWRGALGRPDVLTDATYLAYVSYYLVPLAAVALGRARGPEAGERAAFAVLLTFWLTYLGYLLVPAAGPRIPHAEEAAVLGGGAVSDAVRGFLHAAEKTRLDAFPSGHTAVSLVSAWLVIRMAPRLAPAAVAWAAAVIFSTVYVHVHYAVDVAAGAALAAGVAWGAEPCARWVGAAGEGVSRRLAGTQRRAAGA